MGKTEIRLATLITLSVAAVWAWLPSDWSPAACASGELCVVFLDVGQGDATLIEAPGGEQMLIDGGRGSAVLRELGAVMPWLDRDLNWVVATHPDADHVGGLVGVFDRYTVANILRTENESDTPVWQAVKTRIENEDGEIIYARRGQTISLGEAVTVEVLFPDRDMYGVESNTSSIVLKLTYGEHSFLLTGDSPKSIEEYLVLTEGENLQSTVLKVGHHGSRTSSSELFLNEVTPKYGVISAGKDNQYGHPHVEVTDALFNAGVETFNTADRGRIIFSSDGVSLEVR